MPLIPALFSFAFSSSLPAAVLDNPKETQAYVVEVGDCVADRFGRAYAPAQLDAIDAADPLAAVLGERQNLHCYAPGALTTIFGTEQLPPVGSVVTLEIEAFTCRGRDLISRSFCLLGKGTKLRVLYYSPFRGFLRESVRAVVIKVP